VCSSDLANGNLNNLTSLKIEYSDNISDAGVRAIANGKLTSLTSLNISNCRNITDAGFRAITNGKLTTLSNASAIAVTIPLNSSVAYPVGAQINMAQLGAGQVTVSGAGGVTLVSTGATAATPKTRAQYSTLTCVQTSTDNWIVMGDIS
jgi:hypothetical protein